MIQETLRQFFGLIIEFFSKEEAWWLIFILGFLGVFGAFTLPGFDLLSVLLEVLRLFRFTWWLWLFLILLPLTRDAWKHWRQEVFKQSADWVLLELKMPREVQKSPQAMEQVLQAFHTLHKAPEDVREAYLEGQVTLWFSLEIVRVRGTVHFFIRGLRKQKVLIETAIFSYYPDVEVHEVNDYIRQFPATVPEVYGQNWNLWGTEMSLAREEAYPIKTYRKFEGAADDNRFDPIAVLLEVLGKGSPDEIVGIQILIAPADREWGKRFESLVEKLRKPKMEKALAAGGSQQEVAVQRTPGQVAAVVAVEENLAKPAFHTLIRFLYLAPEGTYNDSFIRGGLVGAFNQYSANDLNSLRPNSRTAPRADVWHWPHVYPDVRVEYRKQRLLWNYRRREVPPETWVGRVLTSYLWNWNFASRRFLMNTEGIATLFHPPTAVVLTAPHLERVESKKAGPPAGLAIFGGEGDIERYV